MPNYRHTPEGSVAAYAPASQGPFRCGDCEHQTELRCHREEVIHELHQVFSLRREASTGSVRIDADACCNFFEKA